MSFRPILYPALEADRRYIAELEKQVMHDYAVALWGKWTEIDPETYDLSEVEIVSARGEPCGILATRLQDGCYRVAKIYLSPDFQGMGIGKQVLDIAKKRAVEKGLPLQLSVLTTNPAYAFYRREGLVEVSRDAERILMEWRAE